MNTQQIAYINGFVKRAAQYGYNEQEALTLLKEGGNFFGNLGNNIDTGINNATQAVGNKINQGVDYAKGLGNQAVQGAKNLGNRALHAVGDPIVHTYHAQVDPWVAGIKAFNDTRNAPYVPKPGQFDYKGPVQGPAAVAPVAPVRPTLKTQMMV
jgi:hypothetical protein